MSVVVEVSARNIQIPHQCACCGGPPKGELEASYTRTSGVRIIRYDTRSLSFPCCAECPAHIKQWKSAGFYANMLSSGAISIGVAIGAGLKFSSEGIVACVACSILGVVLGIVTFIHIRSNARRALKAQCASPGDSVKHLGWSGTVSAFKFASEHYGVRFANANFEKLINMSSQLRRLLESRGMGAHFPEHRWLASGPIGADESRQFEVPRSAKETPRQVPEPVKTPPKPGNSVLDWISRIESFKGAEARRSALQRALAEITEPNARQQLRVAACRIEATAILDKVDDLATEAAKRRHLEKGIATLRAYDIAPALRDEQIRELEARLRALG